MTGQLLGQRKTLMEMVYDIFTSAPKLLIISEILIFLVVFLLSPHSPSLNLMGLNIDHELAIEVYKTPLSILLHLRRK